MKPAGMRPNSAKASSQGCASDGRSRVANVVRVIFAMTFASMVTYFARIFALAGVVLGLVRPDGSVLDRVPEPRDEVRVDVGAGDPERQQAVLRAHGVEGIGEDLQAPL